MSGMFAPVLTSGPASLAASILSDVKLALRVSGSTDDALLTGMIDAYTAHLDGYAGILGRALLTQTWRQDFECFSDRLSLPLAPVSAVTGITYIDTDDVQQTLATSVYELLTDALGPYVARKPNQSWPGLGDGTSAARVKVTFTAGYGAADALPKDLVHAITIATGKLYSFARSDPSLSRDTVQGIGTREWTAGGGLLAEIDRMVDYILAKYRRVAF